MKTDLVSLPFGRTMLTIDEKKRPRSIFGQEESKRETEGRPKEGLKVCIWLDW
jgi:hypothetical protein